MKIEYRCDKDLLSYVKQYNSLLKFTYNRLADDSSLKESKVNLLQKQVKNCDLVNNSWFRTSSYVDAKTMLASDSKGNSIFGGKWLFLQRCQLKISQDEFRIKRLLPLCSIGEASERGNRLFRLIDNETIEFKPSRGAKFILNLQNVGKKRRQILNQLIQLQNARQIPITYKLRLNEIAITYDYNSIQEFNYTVKQNRVIAVDLNPNHVGWSVVDWSGPNSYHVVKAGSFSLKPLNDAQKKFHVASNSKESKYFKNKRDFEVVGIVKRLFDLCKYYHCEVFSIEDLSMKGQDNKKGTKYNRLVNNQWNRNLLVNQIRKRIKASSTTLVEVQPQHSSYIGNLVYRQEKLPDECLASIEIGRRGYEFATQYIFNRRLRSKTVVYPLLEAVKNQLFISLEEIGIDIPALDNWISICQEVKKSKRKYRFSLEAAQAAHASRLLSKFHKRKFLILYEFL